MKKLLLLALLIVGCVNADTIKYEKKNLFSTSKKVLTDVEYFDSIKLINKILLKFKSKSTGMVYTINCNNIIFWKDNSNEILHYNCSKLLQEKKITLTQTDKFVFHIFSIIFVYFIVAF